MSSFYKKYIIPIATTVLFLGLIGCGGGGGSDFSTNTSGGSSSTKATALTLSNADVSIYKVKDDGSLSLLWKEKTSSGDRLEEIGEFNLHADELTDDDFYLYKVTGGENLDTLNKGILRSIAQGVDIKKAGDNFKISYATELFYEEVVPTLKRKFDRTTFPSILNNKVSKIIEDSNNIEDILTFNPREDKEKLKEFYKIRAKTIVDTIHQGKIPALNMSAILGYYNTGSFQTVTLSSDGSKAYVSSNDGLMVMDISNSSNPIRLKSFEIKGIDTITLSNDETKAYVTKSNKDNDSRLIIFDISDSTNLIKRDSYSWVGKAKKTFRFAIDNTGELPDLDDNAEAYVGYNTEQLDSDDNAETYVGDNTELSSYSWEGRAQAITFSSDNTKAYVGENNGLLTIDISNPSHPTKLNFYSFPTQRSGSLDTITLSNDGTKAYMGGNNGLRVIDISNPHNPVELNFLSEMDIDKITLSSDGTKAYVANYNKLLVIDISNSTNLTKLGSFRTTNAWTTTTKIALSNDENKVYMADILAGLVVIDVSKPSNPIGLGYYPTIGTITNNVALSSDGTKAYIARSDGFVVIDISHSINSPKLDAYGRRPPMWGIPTTTGTTTNIGGILNTIQNISPVVNSYKTLNSDIQAVTLSHDGTKAYLINRYDTLTEGYPDDLIPYLVVVDISNPTNLIQLGKLDIIESIGYNIAISNDNTKAYITTANLYKNENSLMVIDISNPTNLVKLGSYSTSYIYDVILSKDDSKAYISYMNSEYNKYGIKVIDVSNPTNLTQTNFYSTKGYPASITLSADNTKAYVAEGSYGFEIIDISDLSNPTKLGVYSYNQNFISNQSARIVRVSNDETKAYLIDYETGLIILDISNPSNPIKLSSYKIGATEDAILSKDGTKIYIANGSHGLTVIDISNPTNPIKLASYGTEGYAIGITLSNDETKAYIADSKSGLVVIDLELYN